MTRTTKDRFRPGDETRMAKRAGYRCEWYPTRLRHGLHWRRCDFRHDDLRYFQQGHFIPLRSRGGAGRTDWATNGILQCPPCNLEQLNRDPPARLVRLVRRDRARLAGLRRGRVAVYVFAAGAITVFATAIHYT